VVPDTKVFVEFNIELVDVEFFTLDDEIKGLLDGTYPLGGDVLVDVTQYVSSVSINRGKSRELDRYTSGQASVTFHNDNRFFDPFFTESPYFQQFVPKRQVVIEANGVRQFTGEIDDIDLTYNLGNKSFATITCSDAFALISNTLANNGKYSCSISAFIVFESCWIGICAARTGFFLATSLIFLSSSAS
jgi:hypothetical protein